MGVNANEGRSVKVSRSSLVPPRFHHHHHGSAFSPRFRCHVGRGRGPSLPLPSTNEGSCSLHGIEVEKENRNGKGRRCEREKERERDYCKVRTRMEKRFSPLPEPSETETARYQGCKEQAEDVNCLVTFPVQPEPWKWPSNEVGSCSDSRKHSNQLSPRLRPVSPFVLSLPDRCLAPWNTRMLRIYIYIYRRG